MTTDYIAAGQLLAQYLAEGWEVNFLSRQRFAAAAYSVSLRWTEGRTCTHIGFGCNNNAEQALREAHADALRPRTAERSRQQPRTAAAANISLDDLTLDL
jgi:hypothetical protein